MAKLRTFGSMPRDIFWLLAASGGRDG
jgi:hypothetical protein